MKKRKPAKVKPRKPVKRKPVKVTKPVRRKPAKVKKPVRRKPVNHKPVKRRRTPKVKPRRKRIRDYKKEYQRKKILDLKRAVERDARRVFGKKPKRKKGEGSKYDDSPAIEVLYEDKLSEDARPVPSVFEWTDEDEFIKSLTDLGMPEQEAYTMWFSP